jgi:hypothetical protein
VAMFVVLLHVCTVPVPPSSPIRLVTA